MNYDDLTFSEVMKYIPTPELKSTKVIKYNRDFDETEHEIQDDILMTQIEDAEQYNSPFEYCEVDFNTGKITKQLFMKKEWNKLENEFVILRRRGKIVGWVWQDIREIEELQKAQAFPTIGVLATDNEKIRN